MHNFHVIFEPANYGASGEIWKQATSYWLTDFGLLALWAPLPAYTVPACPFGLNADPGADADEPGVPGPVVTPQVCDGCQVLPVLAAEADPMPSAIIAAAPPKMTDA